MRIGIARHFENHRKYPNWGPGAPSGQSAMASAPAPPEPPPRGAVAPAVLLELRSNCAMPLTELRSLPPRGLSTLFVTWLYGNLVELPESTGTELTL